MNNLKGFSAVSEKEMIMVNGGDGTTSGSSSQLPNYIGGSGNGDADYQTGGGGVNKDTACQW